MLYRLLGVVGGACLISIAFTWWALESSGVAVITTQGADGPRSTHVWFVVEGEELLVEAGTPENGWFRDIQSKPELELSADLHVGSYLAVPLPNPTGHERIRSLLREEYGARDWWIALIFNTSRSIAVRLEPVVSPATRQISREEGS